MGTQPTAERDSRLLNALAIRIRDLTAEYDAIAIEIERCDEYRAHLLNELEERHDRMVDMRSLAFRLWSAIQRGRAEAA